MKIRVVVRRKSNDSVDDGANVPPAAVRRHKSGGGRMQFSCNNSSENLNYCGDPTETSESGETSLVSCSNHSARSIRVKGSNLREILSDSNHLRGILSDSNHKKISKRNLKAAAESEQPDDDLDFDFHGLSLHTLVVNAQAQAVYDAAMSASRSSLFDGAEEPISRPAMKRSKSKSKLSRSKSAGNLQALNKNYEQDQENPQPPLQHYSKANAQDLRLDVDAAAGARRTKTALVTPRRGVQRRRSLGSGALGRSELKSTEDILDAYAKIMDDLAEL